MLTHVSIFVVFGSSLLAGCSFSRPYEIHGTRLGRSEMMDSVPPKKFVAGSWNAKTLFIFFLSLRSGLEGRVGSGSWCGRLGSWRSARSCCSWQTLWQTNSWAEPVAGLLCCLLFPRALLAVGKSPRWRRATANAIRETTSTPSVTWPETMTWVKRGGGGGGGGNRHEDGWMVTYGVYCAFISFTTEIVLFDKKCFRDQKWGQHVEPGWMVTRQCSARCWSCSKTENERQNDIQMRFCIFFFFLKHTAQNNQICTDCIYMFK